MPKLKIIYASSAMREGDFTELFSGSDKIPGQQAQKFNRLMIKGLSECGARVIAITSPPINKSNTKKHVVFGKKIREGGITYRYLGVVNARRVKNVYTVLSSFVRTFFSCVFRKSAVVCDVLNISVATGAVSAGRLLRKRCVGVVTDIPELMVTGHSEKQVKYCHKLINKCTDYVFLTDAMNERLNPKGKPYTVIEGLCNSELKEREYEDSEHFECMYAGLLDAEYGVKDMVDSFVIADVPNARLHICGSGPYTDELKKVATECDRVIYHGTLMNSEVVEMEQRMTLLINPRPATGEFTKYSFPSKVMEYMTTGTPMLAHKLPGVPDEYDPYYYRIGDDEDGMKNALLHVTSLGKEELYEKGRLARTFVTEKKTPKVQCEKIIVLLNE
ncbi:MAG: glycosyltransferase [Clostridia bacterium]|nr:glycosyltransferase [Clostridia bacterium]